jgi:hypothetical protein
MDLSKVKVELYDFLAVIVPGMLVLCELWITLRGWSRFAQGIATLSVSGFSVLLLVAFALGPLLQELADLTIKRFKGKRYFKSSRDKLWSSPTGTHVRGRITHHLGHEIENVDVAFDFCLTKVQSSFSKRDLFVANSDLARSMIVVVTVAVAPMVRTVMDRHFSRAVEIGVLALGSIALVSIAAIFWARMKRFRELSEKTVFHIFLAQPGEVANSAAGGK